GAEFDQIDRLRVAGLREGVLEQRAGILDAWRADLLWPVQVPERNIVEAFEQADADGPAPPHRQGTLGLALGTTENEGMRHQHHTLPLGPGAQDCPRLRCKG